MCVCISSLLLPLFFLSFLPSFHSFTRSFTFFLLRSFYPSFLPSPFSLPSFLFFLLSFSISQPAPASIDWKNPEAVRYAALPFTYLCIYLYVYIYVSICMYLHIPIYLYLYIYISVNIYAYLHQEVDHRSTLNHCCFTSTPPTPS